MKFDSMSIGDRGDLTGYFHMMKSFSVKVGGKEYKGEGEMAYDDGHVTLSFKASRPKLEVVKNDAE
jgi:hypothetical protein